MKTVLEDIVDSLRCHDEDLRDRRSDLAGFGAHIVGRLHQILTDGERAALEHGSTFIQDAAAKGGYCVAVQGEVKGYARSLKRLSKRLS